MRNPELLRHARHMRANPTPAEARLWYHLRAHRFGNHMVVTSLPQGSLSSTPLSRTFFGLKSLQTATIQLHSFGQMQLMHQ